MKKLNLLLTVIPVAIFFFASTISANAYTWMSYGGHEYSLTEGYHTWLGAEAEAIAQRGHLVTINDASELSFLLANFPNILPAVVADPDPHWWSFFWIGLNCPSGILNDLTKWVWSSGETSTYWQSIRFTGSYDPWDFPYTGGGLGGPHAYLHTTGHFWPGTINNHIIHDTDGNILGVIERSPVPEPTTMLLLGLGLIGLAGVRRFKK